MPSLVLLCGLSAIAGTATASEPGNDFVDVDYAKVERSIAKEPKYVASPRYALFILDPQAKFRVWAVLDKSKADLSYYDVLYFDKDGNGNLTDAGERFVGQYDAKLPELSIRVGDLRVPGTKLTHTDLRFLTVERHGYKGFWFSMNWDGKVHVDGGYGKDTENTEYALSVAKAPILRPTSLGPLWFKCWEPELTLPIGKATDVQLSLGNPGSGADTFCVVSQHYLIEGKDAIVATLITKDREGKEIRIPTEFKKHC